MVRYDGFFIVYVVEEMLCVCSVFLVMGVINNFLKIEFDVYDFVVESGLF